MNPEPLSNLSTKYSGHVWLRSLVQAVPYFGPLIDNAIAIPSSRKETENLYAFLKQVHLHIDELKVFRNTVYDLDNSVAEKSIFPEILTGVKQARDPRKLTYYRNILWAYDFFRTQDAVKALDVFPEQFLQMIRTYSCAHFDTLLLLQEYLDAGETVCFKGEELFGLSKELNIPGGCFMKLLFDFERDCLIDIFFKRQ